MSHRDPAPGAEPVAAPHPTAPPRRAHDRLLAVCLLIIGSAAVFFLTGVTPLPVLLYYPLARRFGFQGATGNAPGELSMDYYGRSLLALLAGTALALCAYALLGSPLFRRRHEPSPPPSSIDGQPAAAAPGPAPAPVHLHDEAAGGRSLSLLTAYAVTALLLAVSLFAYQLSVRVPTPIPEAPVTAP